MTGDSATSSPPDHQPWRLPLWGVVVAAALVVLVMGLRAIADIVAPMFLVMTLVITAQPLRARLVRWRLPGWLASLVVLLVIYLALAAVLGAVVWSAIALVHQLPHYKEAFDRLYEQIVVAGKRLGVESSDISAMLNKIDIGSVTGVAQRIIGQLASGFSLVGLMALTAVFLAFDAASGSERVAAVRARRPRIADAFDDFATRIRSYWIVTTVFGLIVAAIDVVALWIIGVPLALTWGVLAFVTNYIPNLGFVLGLIPPALIGYLSGGLGPASAVIISYIVINFVIQTLIQPRFVGDSAGVNASVAFISLIFWAAILGGLGALLAVPATLFVKAVLVDHTERGEWLGALLNARDKSDRNPHPPPPADRTGRADDDQADDDRGGDDPGGDNRARDPAGPGG